jgi:phage terminase small subunit
MSTDPTSGRFRKDMNARRRRFVAEYLKDLNATQAAIRAGYSPKTANEQGAQLLANLSVRRRSKRARAASSNGRS